MNDGPRTEDLNKATVEYYNMRPILKDMPHRIPRGPTPDGPPEHVLFLKEMNEAMHGRRILEVACGTGARTKKLACIAKFILGTDITPNTLRIAREGSCPENAQFMQCDAFDLGDVTGSFNAGLALGFFHVCPYARHEEFLNSLHFKLEPSSIVFMCSSRPTSPDAKSRLFRHDGHHDQYMTRQLSDGSEYVLVENDYSEDDLRSIFEPISRNLKIHIGRYLWWIQYELP